MDSQRPFPWRRFLPMLASLAIPVALQNLLTTTGSMVDTMMIAPLGERVVGAIGLCAQFTTLIFACYWGFVGGGMLFYAQYWGARDEEGISRAYGTTFSILLTIALFFMSTALFAPQWVMRLYTDKEAIQSIGIPYLRIVSLAYPLQILAICMSSLLRSTERVRIPLFASIASCLANVFLNWVLIYGKFGLPRMGVRGAALATVVASALNLALIVLLARLQGFPYLFRFRSQFRWTRAWLREYLRKCFPIICNELLVGIGFAVTNIVLGRQSEESIAALAVFRTLEGLVIGFFAGFSNAASVLVGKCVGAGELDEAYERAKRLVYLCGGIILCVCLSLLAVHGPLLHAMSLSGESFRIGTGFLAIYCVAALIRMCNWIQNDTYRSAGDTTFGTVLEIVFMYLLVLPCVCLSGLVFHLPVLLVFACCYIDEPIRIVLMQRHMFSGRWIKPVTPQGRAAREEFLRRLDARVKR